ncbi:peptide ABC transporter substrate-binding protein [Rhizobium sp. RM]|uniref:peptide ABC transporter substrate-binding protein n=1 Tax=Rhizobium sp. RM TaxID=2748079 RepID=UPI00110DC9D8|nr:peptide ABC transporter substrate-binding protein [Rhizobium sp. RM]NWJ25749.1 peptide ABC transporter substrate-binding protein [Rhizobium sp. RM]TMV21694.1 peptide ABC transporter substrate-binding protein [Rhizobium sp. Td3]
MTTKNNNFHASRRQVLAMLGIGVTGTAMSGLLGSSVVRAQDAPKGQIVLGFSQEPTVFNPHLLHIEVDEGVYFALFDPLFGVDDGGEFVPCLAAEVPTVANGGVSADGLKWKVKLREGVTWHDGKPLTAEDVKFTMELLVNPKFNSWRHTGHELVRDLTVVSPTELTWTMEKPYAPYASILASTFIVPKHAFDGAADLNNTPFNNAPIGTGPYKWTKRVAGDYIEMAANTSYYGDGPFVERLIVKYIPDLTVMYTQFKTGDLDVVGLQGISADHYEEASALADRTVVKAPGSPVETFSLNLGLPVFQDKAVRQALYMAVDKASIIDALYFGLPVATESYMPQQAYYHNGDLPKHEFNIEKASALLEEAGWKLGSDGVRAKDGLRLSFENSTTSGNHLREQMQQFLQQTFAQIGAEMTIRNLPPAVMWGDHWMLSQYQSAIAGIVFLTGGDPDTSDYFSSKSIAAQGGAGQNTWQWKNEDVDKLLAEGAAIFVPEERKKTYAKIQALVRDELPFLPLHQFTDLRGFKKGFEGYVPNVNVRIDSWNVNSWRWS